MKRMLAVMSVLVVLWVGVFVIRETAQIITMAAMVHPLLGHAVLALLLVIYGVGLGLPVVLYLRLPPPLRWPADGSAEAITRYRQRFAERLSQNPALKEIAVHATDPASLEEARRVLAKEAQADITQTASMVFLSTAVSQSGRLDALMVFLAQTRLIWRIAHLYWQRPNPRDLLQLYANVFITVFLAQSLDDLDVHEVVTPVLGPVFTSAGIGAIPGAGGVATVVADALLEGTVNAFLTLRVGCITRQYCASETAFDRRMIRWSATREAAALLPGVVGQSAGLVTAAIWAVAKGSGITKAAAAVGDMVGNATGAVTTTLAEGAQTVTTMVVHTGETVVATTKEAARTVGQQVSEITNAVTTNAAMLPRGWTPRLPSPRTPPCYPGVGHHDGGARGEGDPLAPRQGADRSP
jgi:Domain of unknown function (DUF697)